MPTILVVEDDPIARNLIVQVLTGLGFRVFEADTAAEAWIVCRSMRDHSLDMVIAAHALPQTTGREVAERIADLCPDVKVLQISALPYQRMQDENALLPGSSFLQKPFTSGQLATTVQSILTPRKQ